MPAKKKLTKKTRRTTKNVKAGAPKFAKNTRKSPTKRRARKTKVAE